MYYVDGKVVEWIESGIDEFDLSKSNEVLQCLFVIMIAKEEFREGISELIVKFIITHLSAEFETGENENMDSAVQSLSVILSEFNKNKTDAVDEFLSQLFAELYEFVSSCSSTEDGYMQFYLTQLLNVLVQNGLDRSLVKPVIMNGLQTFPVPIHIEFFANYLDLLDEEIISAIHSCEKLAEPPFKRAILYLVTQILLSQDIPNEEKLERVETVFPRAEIYECINDKGTNFSSRISDISIKNVYLMININSDIFNEAIPYVITLASTTQYEQPFFSAMYLLASVSSRTEDERMKASLIGNLLAEFQGEQEEIVALMNANEEEVNFLILSYDEDSNGTLSYSEFLNLVQSEKSLRKSNSGSCDNKLSFNIFSSNFFK